MKKQRPVPQGFLLLEFVVALGLFVLFVNILTRLHHTVNITRQHAVDRMVALQSVLTTLANSAAPTSCKRISVTSKPIKTGQSAGGGKTLKLVKGKWQTPSEKTHHVCVVGV